VTWDQVLVRILWPAIAAIGIGGFVFWFYLPAWSGFAARSPHDRAPLPQTLLPLAVSPAASVSPTRAQQTGPPIACLSEQVTAAVDGDQQASSSTLHQRDPEHTALDRQDSTLAA
jgi:hypothetical protein